jgi:hypothetical protein
MSFAYVENQVLDISEYENTEIRKSLNLPSNSSKPDLTITVT